MKNIIKSLTILSISLILSQTKAQDSISTSDLLKRIESLEAEKNKIKEKT